MTVANPKRPKPHTLRSHGAEQRRLVRQAEAEERKSARAERTPQQQINVLVARGVTSGREWDRLHKKIEADQLAQTEAGRQERRKKYKKDAK